MKQKRHICWPDPDATCLEGGCSHCIDHPERSVSEIELWAGRAGQVRNRGNDETQDARTALAYWQLQNPRYPT
jgi:hypothetical protein